MVISIAGVGNKVSLAPKNPTFLSDKNCWNARQAETLYSSCSLSSGGLKLTFVWVASLDVSGDTDHSQGVDACKAKE